MRIAAATIPAIPADSIGMVAGSAIPAMICSMLASGSALGNIVAMSKWYGRLLRRPIRRLRLSWAPHPTLFVTASTFSSSARDTADMLSKRIVLIDGNQLTRLMLRHGVGCRVEETLTVKAVDEEFFEA